MNWDRIAGNWKHRAKADQNRNRSDPRRPAYDNPVGNKGRLVTGNNVREEDKAHGSDGRRAGEPKAIGHESDKKLGRKPAND